jgi:hypothetical protein
MSHINFYMKSLGQRSAGKPHAALDVAGAGNGTTEHPKRARRGKPRIQPRVFLTSYRASPRPYLCEPSGVVPLGDTTVLK